MKRARQAKAAHKARKTKRRADARQMKKQRPKCNNWPSSVMLGPSIAPTTARSIPTINWQHRGVHEVGYGEAFTPEPGVVYTVRP